MGVRVPYWLAAFPNMGEVQMQWVVSWTMPAFALLSRSVSLEDLCKSQDISKQF